MVVLHIANLTRNKASGVNVVVPKHVFYQAKKAEVGILNLGKGDYSLLPNYFTDFSKLLSPFDKPDIAVFHGIYFPGYVKIAQALTRMKIPYIVVPHGSLTKNAIKTKWYKKIPAHILLFNKFIKGAAAVHFLCKGEMRTSVFSSKGIVVPNGIYDAGDKADIKVKNKSDLNFVFIGRKDIRHKGLDILIKACELNKELIISNNAKIHLHGPGDDNTLSEIDKLINKAGLEGHIQNAPPVYGEEKAEVLTSSSLFIHTSRWEGLPTAVLEAMLYGLPALITEGTGLYDDIIEHNAGWAAKTDIQSVAEEIKKILSGGEKLREYGQNAKKFAKENYEWNKVAEKTLKTYAEIIKK